MHRLVRSDTVYCAGGTDLRSSATVALEISDDVQWAKQAGLLNEKTKV